MFTSSTTIDPKKVPIVRRGPKPIFGRMSKIQFFDKKLTLEKFFCSEIKKSIFDKRLIVGSKSIFIQKIGSSILDQNLSKNCSTRDRPNPKFNNWTEVDRAGQNSIFCQKSQSSFFGRQLIENGSW